LDWSRLLHLSPADFQGLFSRRAVILAVMAVVLYQGVGIFYKAATLQLVRMRPAPAAETLQPAAAPVREPADAYRAIPERNLFNTATKPVGGDRQAVVQQDIALAIDLRGTVAGEGKYGFAIIEEKGTKKQRLVKAGDVVAGAQVVRIKRNAIDLIVNDQERTLKITERPEGPILPAQAASAAAAPLPPPPAGAVVLSRGDVQEALEDMGSLLRQAQIRPYFNAGVPDGFLITNIMRGSIYQRIGIVNGDIIQEVNNRKIQTADDMSGLLNMLKSNPDLSLTVRRRGSPQTLNVRFQ